MTAATIGWIFPAAAGALITGAGYALSARPPVEDGIAAGVSIAVAQTYLSTAALRWAWNKSIFWTVWGSGVLLRLLVFAATALVIYRFTQLSLVATMTSMVASTTVFLVVESAVCLKG